MPVYKFNDGRKGWYFKLTFNGKQYKREKGMATKQEALAAEYEFKKKLEIELQRENGHVLLSELLDEYIVNAKSNLKESSKHEYIKFKRCYLIYIQDKIIFDYKPIEFANWKNQIVSLDIKVVTKNKIINMMKGLLRYGQLMYDLSAKLQIPLLESIKDNSVIESKKKEVYLPPEKFELLIDPLKKNIIDNSIYYLTILELLYHTGLRIGELAALQVKDYFNGCLNINKDYVRVNRVDIIQKPKNENSIRVIPLKNGIISLIDEFLVKYGRITPDEIIFHLESKYLNQQKLRRLIDKLAKSSNLDEQYDIHPHSLRHSYNTNLKNAGVDIYTRAKLLGNTPEVNAEIYTHTNLEELKKIIEKL